MLTGYHICYEKRLLLAFKGRCGFSLNNLVELQGCEIISNMYVGKSAKYTNPEVVKEMQEVLSQCRC